VQRMVFALSMFLGGCCACPPPVQQPDNSQPDAGSTIPVDDTAPDGAKLPTCSTGCAKLASLGCSEGKDKNCVAVCTQIQATKLTTTCWTSATTVQQARACGVKCSP